LLTAAENPPAELPPATPRAVDFVRDIQPILAEHCVRCHGAEKQRGGVRLDDRKAALQGGNAGEILKAGDAHKSRLMQVIAGFDPDMKMPPGDRSLSREQLSLVRAWIEQGAKWPEGAATVTGATRSTHWSFQPIVRPTLPVVRDARSVFGPIDRFVQARLEKEGLAPNPEADPFTLLRRITLDLTGLPPTPEEVDTFEALARRDPTLALEQAVDRLLASPAYGERWARHWLDLARYADSDGYEKDTGRPWAYRYRDWVIAALNADLPFDRFTIEQLAGDLLPGATLDQKIATGFHRNTLTNKEGGVDPEQFRVEAVIDRVSTTGQTWLGLTFGCAQCHDHKYDPVSQREFYQLFAFFNSDLEANIPAPIPGDDRYAAQKAEHEAKLAKAEKIADEKERTKALTALKKTAPQPPQAQTLSLGKKRPTHVHIRGDFLRKGIPVEAATPAVLPPLKANQPTRLDLAKWLIDPRNPLTRRVIVNWVWSKFFGRGLVATPEDFGTQGQKPSHPELLDWLADEFSSQGWSLKRLHRAIVLSATYRRSSHPTEEMLTRDPYNILLARQIRMRLEAETLRDVNLAVSGLLAPRVGGPSVRPPQPAGISELTYAGAARWVESKGADRYRRGLYIWFQRTSPYPLLTTFDSPDANVCVVKRERSNTPLQALTLLNDPVFVESAQHLGKRLLLAPGNDEDRLGFAVRLCLGREATSGEVTRLRQLLLDFREVLRDKPAEAQKFVGAISVTGYPAQEIAAWVGVARAITNLDEFVVRE
jgi:mono/diheme cytochrome c family protein